MIKIGLPRGKFCSVVVNNTKAKRIKDITCLKTQGGVA